MMKILNINYIKKKFTNISNELSFFLKNKYFILISIKHAIKGEKIFDISSSSIGHYPVDLYLASKIYGKKSIFVFNPETNFSNTYLVKKISENYNVKNHYIHLIKVQKKLNYLLKYFTNIFSTQPPSILHMTEKHNYAQCFDGKSKIFDFNNIENEEGLSFLKKHNIKKEKYICFIVRSAEYYISTNRQEREKSYSYRNVNPENYIPTLEYLIKNGYKIIRMGKGVKTKFPYENKNFIDYATSEDRSDFLDIWLSAHCKFFLSNSTGIAMMPILFNLPIINTNEYPGLRSHSWIPKSIHVPRNVMDHQGKYLNVKQQIEKNLHWLNSSQFTYKGLQIVPIENSSEEILKTVIEMENQIKKGFIVSDLNIKFWKKTKTIWDYYTLQNKLKNKPFEHSDQFTFDHFHKIDGIKTIIPDYYLEKYKDIFIDY